MRKLFLLLLFSIVALAALPANAQQVKTTCPNGENPILQTVDTSDGRFVQPLCVDSSGKLDLNAGSSNGKAALKPATGDAVQFVSGTGSDSNDGLSWGTAKTTLGSACAAIPGGNSSCTAGNGTIYLSSSFSQTLTGGLQIGSSSSANAITVVFLPGAALTFNGTMTNGLTLGYNTTLIGAGGTGPTGSIQTGASANISGCLINQVAGVQRWGISGMTISAAAGTVASTLCVNAGFVNAVVRDSVIAASVATTLVNVTNADVFEMKNNWINCQSIAGCVAFKAVSGAASTITDVTVVGGAIEHQGAAVNLVLLDGTASIDTLEGISFDRVQFESNTSQTSGTHIVQVKDCVNCAFYSPAFDAGTISGVNDIDMTQTNAGGLGPIAVINELCTGSGGCLQNHKSGSFMGSGFVAGYFYPGDLSVTTQRSTLLDGPLGSPLSVGSPSGLSEPQINFGTVSFARVFGTQGTGLTRFNSFGTGGFQFNNFADTQDLLVIPDTGGLQIGDATGHLTTLVVPAANVTVTVPSASGTLALAGANGVSAGTITLAAGAGSHTFSTAYGTAPICTATDTTSANTVKATSSTTAITLAGTTTDVIAWICTPAAN